MENKAHRRRDYSPADRMSRTERDLSSCSQGSDSSDNSTLTMLKRALPRGRCKTNATNPHVCVIGAGVAGLRCTEMLVNQGIRVTILEGRDRLGGRVHQNNLLGHVVDMGPNWIHGTDHNPILDLAHETGTVTSSTGEGSHTFDEYGNFMDQKTANVASDIFWGIVADAFKHSNVSSSIPPDRSLQDFFTERLGEKKLSRSENSIVLQMAQFWGAFIGDPIERQSLKYFWLEECIDGENLFVASTYKAILARIAKPALAKATVRLSTKVTAVQSRGIDLGENSKVSVITADETLHFDEAVITVPLGCLKHNLPKISPSIPRHISRAIANVCYGRLEKVYITFPTAFWNPSSDKICAKTVGSESDQSPFFSHFLHPQYHTGNPRGWNIELASLASVLPTETLHPTLLFYIHGPCATHVTNLITKLHPSSADYYARLNDFFHPYYSRLANFSAKSEACVPIGLLATDWQHDEFAGYGSYTNFQISPPVGEGKEEVELDKDIEALREGMPEQGIWFAGEHTAPFVALGTVTGAWWSGEGVGRRILAKYGLHGESEGAEQEPQERAI